MIDDYDDDDDDDVMKAFFPRVERVDTFGE